MMYQCIDFHYYSHLSVKRAAPIYELAHPIAYISIQLDFVIAQSSI